MGPIPVFMYHHINPHRGDTVTVTPEVFAGQLEYLAEAGYRTLSLGELYHYLTGKMPLDRKSVVLTFDDGWRDNYRYAYPLLQTYGFKAAMFVITGRANAACSAGLDNETLPPRHDEAKRLIAQGHAGRVVLDWDTMGSMQQSGLVEFYSHTVSHSRCAELDRAELTHELVDSRRIMEQKLGRPCPYLCWPYGSFSDLTVAMAVEAGYEALFTTNHGTVAVYSDPFLINRIEVRDSIDWFVGELQQIKTNTPKADQ